ncbi:MAG: hypothetical protein ABR591_10780 [Candidatus Velthaea sp.]
MSRRLGGIDPMMFVRAVGLLARNPSIAVVPLLVNVLAVFVSQLGGAAMGGGGIASLTGGIISFMVLILQLYAFGAAVIIGDGAWRRGRASFDDGWNEARRRGGDIFVAALGFTFVLYIAQYAGQLFGPLALVLLAVAVFFLIYTIPAAAIGGVPGGAAIQISIERARYHPVPTIVVAVVSVAATFAAFMLLLPALGALAGPISFASATLVLALFAAVVQSIVTAYVALIVGKTYSDISYGRRF